MNIIEILQRKKCVVQNIVSKARVLLILSLVLPTVIHHDGEYAKEWKNCTKSRAI